MIFNGKNDKFPNLDFVESAYWNRLKISIREHRIRRNKRTVVMKMKKRNVLSGFFSHVNIKIK